MPATKSNNEAKEDTEKAPRKKATESDNEAKKERSAHMSEKDKNLGITTYLINEIENGAVVSNDLKLQDKLKELNRTTDLGIDDNESKKSLLFKLRTLQKSYKSNK